MTGSENVFSGEEDPRQSPEALERARRRLVDLFGNMDHEVPLLLFTDPFINVRYCEAVRAIIRMPFSQLIFAPDDNRSIKIMDTDGVVHSVPLHRIKEVYRNNELIWHQRH